VLFQISAVLAITVLAREGRARRPAEAWRPFGFAGHWGSMHGVLEKAQSDALPEAPGPTEPEAPNTRSLHRVQRENPTNRDALEAVREEKVVELTQPRVRASRPGKPTRRTSKPRAERQALAREPRILPVEQGSAVAERSAGTPPGQSEEVLFRRWVMGRTEFRFFTVATAVSVAPWLVP
jgi:hypothetical protein